MFALIKFYGENFYHIYSEKLLKILRDECSIRYKGSRYAGSIVEIYGKLNKYKSEIVNSGKIHISRNFLACLKPM